MKKILFITGNYNQTTMMYQVFRELADANDCWFAHYYADGYLRFLAEHGWLDFTILGGASKQATMNFIKENGLPFDYRGESLGNDYDLVVTSSDLIVQRNIRTKKIVVIQEGMTDPEDWKYHLVTKLGLPIYLANTSTTGLSHAYTKLCVASPGYRDLFIKKGVKPEKIRVTGIPNFDNAASYLTNDFPHRNYILAATSALRETLKYENRKAFIRRALEIADGRPLIFKLHPNENHRRAAREIEREAPRAIIFDTGNTNHMIANCDTLVTKYSSVVYVGVALHKKVYSDLDPAVLQRLCPIQNGGTSAKNIADTCRECLEVA